MQEPQRGPGQREVAGPRRPATAWWRPRRASESCWPPAALAAAVLSSMAAFSGVGPVRTARLPATFSGVTPSVCSWESPFSRIGRNRIRPVAASTCSVTSS